MAQIHYQSTTRLETKILEAAVDDGKAEYGRERPLAKRYKKRVNKINTDLAYVPVIGTPLNSSKDCYPLYFYGVDSGQRYPKLHSKASTTFSEQSMPVSGKSFYSDNTPIYEPAPPPVPPKPWMAPTAHPRAAAPEAVAVAPSSVAPRSAIRQRYVTAGGNARLEDRPEIAGPNLMAPASGAATSMSKAEVDAKLSDPEWVREHFGDEALALVRKDDSAAPHSRRSTGRSSDSAGSDCEGAPVVGKRDRTSSGASRLSKLRSVFSRKNSASE